MRRVLYTLGIGIYLGAATVAVWQVKHPSVALAAEDAPLAPVVLDFWTYG